MNGAPASPLPPSIVFDTQDPKWFERYYQDAEAEKNRLRTKVAELEKDLRAGMGLRDNGPREVKIGNVRFTETETGILRSFSGFGTARRDRHGGALYRHISNIRKKFREANCGVIITTEVGVGYNVSDEDKKFLKRLVSGEAVKKRPALKATAKVLNLENRSAA